MFEQVRYFIGDFFIHLGWAFFGQTCECGSNPFNWIARRVDGKSGWDAEGEPHGWTKVKFEIGHYFVMLGSGIKVPYRYRVIAPQDR
jgi:hypothetical protein